jgi:hypothetical protein
MRRLIAESPVIDISKKKTRLTWIVGTAVWLIILLYAHQALIGVNPLI